VWDVVAAQKLAFASDHKWRAETGQIDAPCDEHGAEVAEVVAVMVAEMPDLHSRCKVMRVCQRHHEHAACMRCHSWETCMPTCACIDCVRYCWLVRTWVRNRGAFSPCKCVCAMEHRHRSGTNDCPLKSGDVQAFSRGVAAAGVSVSCWRKEWDVMLTITCLSRPAWLPLDSLHALQPQVVAPSA
jgi:hypothetical protein